MWALKSLWEMTATVFRKYFSGSVFQVESASEATLSELVEEILRCGYTGPIRCEKKEDITR